MRNIKGDSWSIAERNATDLEHLLYLRDAFALGSDLDIPPLTPLVGSIDLADAAIRSPLDVAWRHEWTRATTGNDGEESERDSERPPWYSALGNTLWIREIADVEDSAIARTRARDIANLTELETLDATERRKRRNPRFYGDLVAAAEQRAGRTAAPFRLTVDVVPLNRPVILRSTRTRVIVSQSPRSDPHAFATAVADILDELLDG